MNILNKTKVLDLKYINIDITSIVEISKMLSINTSLHILDLGGNNIGIKGDVRIAKMLDLNYSLTKVYLEQYVPDLYKILERNKPTHI